MVTPVILAQETIEESETLTTNLRTFTVNGRGFAYQIPQTIESESISLVDESNIGSLTTKPVLSSSIRYFSTSNVYQVTPLRLPASITFIVKVFPVDSTPATSVNEATANKLLVPRGKITINGMEYLIDNEKPWTGLYKDREFYLRGEVVKNDIAYKVEFKGKVVDKTDRGYIITMGGSLGNDDIGFRLHIKGIAVQAPVAVSVDSDNE